eukprot:3321192-Pyramimonas_sp.AAC.1
MRTFDSVPSYTYATRFKMCLDADLHPGAGLRVLDPAGTEAGEGDLFMPWGTETQTVRGTNAGVPGAAICRRRYTLVCRRYVVRTQVCLGPQYAYGAEDNNTAVAFLMEYTEVNDGADAAYG